MADRGTASLIERLRDFLRHPREKLERRRTDFCRAVLYRSAYLLARLRRRSTLHVWPAVPPKGSATILKVARQLGIRLRQGTFDDRPLLIWEDRTRLTARPPPDALNAGCTDISKSRVQAEFEDIFGYGYAVDPLTHRGPMVVKSDENGTHDGRIVVGPIAAREPDVVYQRDIDGRISETEMFEYRLPVVLGDFPSVYVKTRLVTKRFASNSTHTRVVTDLRTVFSEAELDRLRDLCAAFALDFGELDILRDRSDGRIYVLDVNKTPHGPPKSLTVIGAFRAIGHIARALDAWPALRALPDQSFPAEAGGRINSGTSHKTGDA